eukprot:7133642-Prorocentrum_lima.AAC.1
MTSAAVLSIHIPPRVAVTGRPGVAHEAACMIHCTSIELGGVSSVAAMRYLLAFVTSHTFDMGVELN